MTLNEFKTHLLLDHWDILINTETGVAWMKGKASIHYTKDKQFLTATATRIWPDSLQKETRVRTYKSFQECIDDFE